MSPSTAESVSTLIQVTGWMQAAGFCSSFEDLDGFVFLLSCFVVVVVVFVIVLGLFVAVVLERFSVLVFFVVYLFGFEVILNVGWGFIWLVLLFLPNSLPFFDLLQMVEKRARGRETSSALDLEGMEGKFQEGKSWEGKGGEGRFG